MSAPQTIVMSIGWDHYAVGGPDHARQHVAAAAALADRIMVAFPDAVRYAAALTWAERRACLDSDAQAITESADELMFGDREGDLALLVRVVAILALQPGGITFLGHRWAAVEA